MTEQRTEQRDCAAMCRRRFLATLPLVPFGVKLGLDALSGLPLRVQPRRSLAPPASDTLVKVVFLRVKEDSRSWPGAYWDPDEHRQQYTREFSSLAEELGIRVAFEENLIYDQAGAAQYAEQLKADPPDGVIAALLHRGRWDSVGPLIQSGVPAVLFAPMGTAFHDNFAEPSRQTGVYAVSAVDGMSSVRYGMKMLKARRQMREAKVLALRGDETDETELPKLGTTLRTLPRSRFVEAFQQIEDTDEVRAMARDYARRAQEVREPSARDVLHAYKTYVAARLILEAEEGNAITMDCLGNIGALKGVPCVGWSLLLDEGTPAACEADLDAMLAHMLVQYLFDKPAFQQDPVPDTETNLFIGAHCTSPTRLYGFDQPPEPFILRSHHWYRETDQEIGVAVQVLWRKGQKITLLDFEGPERLLIGCGRVVGNVETPPSGGCRTSVAAKIYGRARVRDCRGFHQVLFYGDHDQQLKEFCQLFDFEWVHV